MSAHRRRAVLAVLAALAAAVVCAVLAAADHSGARRVLLVVLVLAWLGVAASCLRTATRPPDPAQGADAPGSEVVDDSP